MAYYFFLLSSCKNLDSFINETSKKQTTKEKQSGILGSRPYLCCAESPRSGTPAFLVVSISSFFLLRKPAVSDFRAITSVCQLFTGQHGGGMPFPRPGTDRATAENRRLDKTEKQKAREGRLGASGEKALRKGQNGKGPRDAAIHGQRCDS